MSFLGGYLVLIDPSIGIVLAYFANYGCQVNMGDNTHKRWVNEYI